MVIGFRFEEKCELYYNEGIRLIENASSMAEKKTEDVRILNALKSLKVLWETKNFYSQVSYSLKACYGELLTILNNELRFFSDKRRKNITFAECEEKMRETVKQLEKYILDEKEVEYIREINKRKGERTTYTRVMTSQKFLEKLDLKIKELEIIVKYDNQDRYANRCQQESIKKYQGIKEVIQKSGVSDSYMAQIVLQELMNELDRWNGFSVVHKIPLLLEIYRCIVKESTASEKELRMEYSPCI